jgi:hypothetical protein
MPSRNSTLLRLGKVPRGRSATATATVLRKPQGLAMPTDMTFRVNRDIQVCGFSIGKGIS